MSRTPLTPLKLWRNSECYQPRTSNAFVNDTSRRTPISPPRVKGVDLLRPVASQSATAEVNLDRVLLQCRLRFQRWYLVDDEVPNTY